MSELLVLALGCALQISDTRATPSEAGWVEEVRYEVGADPMCPWVEVRLPPDVLLAAVEGKQRFGDGTRQRVAPYRVQPVPRRADGWGGARVHIPEMQSGDRILLDVVRHWPPGPLEWAPEGTRYATLTTRGDAQLDTTGAVRGRPERGRVFVADAEPGDRVALSAPGHPPASERPSTREAVPLRTEQRLELVVPEGDPQLFLFPGGGSSVRVETLLEFGPDLQESAWPIPAPAHAEIALAVEPRDAARIERRADDAILVLAGSEASARVTLDWTQPDAPTFGRRPDEVANLVVRTASGTVRWEPDGRTWWLEEVNGRPVLPARAALLTALDRRFRAASVPEPGVPNELRGREADWDLASDLRSALRERTALATWPADPLFPRRLVQARKSGAVTGTEASLIMWLYARQERIGADWAIARPFDGSPAPLVSPAGFTEGLVRLELNDEVRWMDPGCAMCAPFELRPELEGVAALAAGGTIRTPAPTPGRWAVHADGDRVTASLSGPAALELRRALATRAEADRAAALVAHTCAGGGRLAEVDGLSEAGADITLVVERCKTPTDPLDLDQRLSWIGTRSLRTEGEVRPGSLTAEGLSWVRRAVDGGTEEVLTLSERAISPQALDQLRAARSEPTPTPPPPEP